MSFENYRGVRISLVSRSDIRYEGTLDDVNPDTSSIALTNVRSFGTEGRADDPRSEVAPQNKIFPYICFRASDVKDLYVLEQPIDAPPPDPAIIDYQLPSANTTSQTLNSSSDAAHAFTDRGPPLSNRQVSRSRSPPREDRSRTHQQGGHRGGRGGYRGGRGGGRPLGPVMPKGEFNFVESNAKLDKEALAREFARMNVEDSADDSDADEACSNEAKVVIPPREVFYDKKSSFFDNISCEAQDRAQRGNMDYQQRRQRMYQERRTNMETFGVTSANPRYGRGGRGGRALRNGRRNDTRIYHEADREQRNEN